MIAHCGPELPPHALLEARSRILARFPIVEYRHVELRAADRDRLVRVAERLQRETSLSLNNAFGPAVSCGLDQASAVVIEDHHAIRLFEILGTQEYSYRALLLAGEGDQAIVGAARSPAFERYCQDVLCLGPVESLEPTASGACDSLAVRCLKDRSVIDRLVGQARRAGTLNVIPYMGTGGVWALAGTVAQRANVPVRVAAPPPQLTRCVNDKLWFSRLVEAVFGKQAVPDTRLAFGSATLATQAATLAARHPRVVVKLRDSASSKGNILLSAPDITGLPLRRVRELLLDVMQRAGWKASFPVLVSAWESPVLDSPSLQLWIPEASSGEPIVEGIFDQRFLSVAEQFTGAVPTTLPQQSQDRLAYDGMQLGFVLQRLGYFGRCSFDAIFVGRHLESARLHWIECNGRWGGVSIPMTLANRLLGDWRRQPFVIAQRGELDGPRRTLETVLELLRGHLYSTSGEPQGAVILSPSPLEQGTGYGLLVFGTDVGAAADQANRIDTLLYGRS